MCNCCCKIKLIFMGIVALSLTLISLCALARTVCGRHHRGGEHHGRWGHGGRECGEWGHGGGCGMSGKMGMMKCWKGEDEDEDGGKWKEGRHGGEERRGGEEHRAEKK